jgi:hypothetical protein
MLFNRFKEYLDKQFRNMPDNREVSDFREELLGNLMSRAMELKEKALSEDEVYKQCIDSLGDYSDTMRKLAGNPIHTLRDKRFHRDILYGMMFALFCVIAYIAASYATQSWGLLAICIFPAMGVLLYLYFTVKAVIRFSLTSRHTMTGLILVSYTVLITLAAFFFTAFATPVGPGRAWVLTTFIPFFVIGAVMINRVFFRKAKLSAGLIVAAIAALGVAVYLLVAVITGIWHPTWLIVLAGPLAALIAGIIHITKKLDNK